MSTNEMMDRCHAGGKGENVTRMPTCHVCCQGNILKMAFVTQGFKIILYRRDFFFIYKH